MSLHDYFESTKGFGVLATADSAGAVDAAVYSRPHVVDEQTVAFIMADRLSHANLQSNPKAAYLFREEGKGYSGKRLFLTKVREETDAAGINELRRRASCAQDDEARYLVYFRVDKVLPLIGEGQA